MRHWLWQRWGDFLLLLLRLVIGVLYSLAVLIVVLFFPLAMVDGAARWCIRRWRALTVKTS